MKGQMEFTESKEDDDSKDSVHEESDNESMAPPKNRLGKEKENRY